MAATQRINPAPFIAALRIIVNALSIGDADRSAILAAIEQRARIAHNVREAAGARRRHATNPVRRVSTPETRARAAAYMRVYRARVAAKRRAATLTRDDT